jgi:peptide/nickel transport system substrate-binding protein
MKGGWKYLLLLASVVLAFAFLISGMGYAGWELSTAGKFNFDEVEALEPGDRRPTEAKGTHTVEEWPESRGRDFREAPMLQARVAAGELPPVSARLPENPQVVVPPEHIGVYGGTWPNYTTGPSDLQVQEERISYTGLIRWDPMYQDYRPELAERWEVSKDGRVFTFWLRKGVKWSDGVPFTADDILFWWNDVVLNADITPFVALVFKPHEKLMKVEKLDDYAVRFSFEYPSGLFMDHLAHGVGNTMERHPAHYMKQFHASYVPKEELDAKVKAASYTTWTQMFKQLSFGTTPDKPVLTPWVCKTDLTDWPMMYERNPYYWKVDPDGNQLPYIDGLRFDNLDIGAIQFRALQGEIGYFFRSGFLREQQYSLYMRNRKSGRYRVVYRIADGMTHTVCFNMSHRDPDVRALFLEPDFRKAMSIAINRDEINEACFLGWGSPRQVVPYSFSPVYNAEYEKAWTEYDPAGANRMLDGIGLDKRDDEGYRLLPNGRPLAIYLECSTAFSNSDVVELLARYWRDVGVRTDVKVLGRTLFEERLKSNMFDAAMWAGGVIMPIFDSRSFFPDRNTSRMGPEFGYWYQSQRQFGEKPPPIIEEAMNLRWEINDTADREQQNALFREILRLSQENLWHIGLVGGIPEYKLVADNFHNVAEVAVEGRYSPGELAPECFYIDPQ